MPQNDTPPTSAREEFERMAGIKPNDTWTTADYRLRIVNLEQELEIEKLKRSERRPSSSGSRKRYFITALAAIALVFGAFYLGKKKGIDAENRRLDSAARYRVFLIEKIARKETEIATKPEQRAKTNEWEDKADARTLQRLRDRLAELDAKK